MELKEISLALVTPLILLSAMAYQWKTRPNSQELKNFIKANGLQITITILAILVSLFTIQGSHNTSRQATPIMPQNQNSSVELERRLQERREYDHLQARLWEETKRACGLAAQCRDFVRQRQACATAGQYQTCMRIRMGSSQFWFAESNCREDGSFTHISGLAQDRPSSLQCLPHDIIRLQGEVQEFLSKIF